MRTVDQLDKVQSEARKAVMVTDPGYHLPGDDVFVADLTKKNDGGSYQVWVEPRGQWLDRVMPRASVAKLDPPQSKPRRARRRRATPPVTSKVAQAPAAAPSPAATARPQVVVFGTSWCPSCRMAKQFLAQRGVRYVDLDVEKNQAAAQKMLEIQRSRGMKPGSVPLIIVGNRVFQGFSRVQIEAALANINA